MDRVVLKGTDGVLFDIWVNSAEEVEEIRVAYRGIADVLRVEPSSQEALTVAQLFAMLGVRKVD